MGNKQYRHLIWDWNGTLMNDTWLCVEVINGLLEKESLPLVTEESYRRHFDFPVVDYYRRLGFKTDQESFEKMSHLFIGEYNRRRWECQLHTGTEDLLPLLADLGMTHSILSAYQKDTLVEIIHHYRLESHFQKLNGLDDIFAREKVDLGLRYLKEIHFDPAEILLIGDTTHDFEVAHAMGVDCVLLHHGHHHHEKLQTVAELVLPDLEALGAFLQGE